jgi:sulfur carrier protein ThiS
MKIFIEREKKSRDMKFNGKAKQLLDALGIVSEDVIISRNDEIVTLDDKLNDKDDIKILAVISGG